MRSSGFSLYELAVVVVMLVVVGALVSTILPKRANTTVRIAQDSWQLRYIAQALVVFAETNNGRLPGISNKADDVRDAYDFKQIDMNPTRFGGTGQVLQWGAYVEPRLWEVLSRNQITGEVVVSPFEVKDIWTTGPLTKDQYSYALLQLPSEGRRRVGWTNRVNSDAPIASERNTGDAVTPQSVRPGLPGWQGNVAFGDVHVEMLTTHRRDTKYGSVSTKNDHLFDAATNDDALMIHSGR